eukprot:CAMPEP_0179463524 /NCGR_PEP_ID=MMETSP0799-20121207/45570_1 /TAXON_ID=46947 /ORGANISM="Geminigera cryophila, Strain CCMP2564" /LENGTH=181 /DNA_ID=CAMNT_0021266853 /DNA_START=91 /DNA_END=633 /DNA_ORIENTATION=-
MRRTVGVFVLLAILVLHLALVQADDPKPQKPNSAPGSSKPKSLGLRATVKDILHRDDVHAAKSVLVMADVALVIAGIQLQLSMVHEQLMALKLGEFSASSHHHQHQAHAHHHTEHLAAQGSTAILAILLLHSLTEVWALGVGKFMKNTALVVDLFVVATSLYLEVIFESLQGMARWYAEVW